MSKKCKKLAKQKNLIKKRSIRAANKAKYDAWRDAGQNSKSKRARSKTGRVNTTSHPNGACGNIGCTTCDPCKIHGSLVRTKYVSYGLRSAA